MTVVVVDRKLKTTRIDTQYRINALPPSCSEKI
jgi:hypothetical protein